MSEVKVDKGQAVAKSDAREGVRHTEGFRPMFPTNRFAGFSPFTLMRQFTDEMDRMFRGWGDGAKANEWSPAIDVQRCDGKMVVAAELPGLKREEVKVEVTDEALIIQGERKREHKEDHEGIHRWERNYGHFYRALPLPEGAQTDQAKAELKDGVLKVSVPVAETRKEIRQIPIEEGTKASPAVH